MAGGQRTTQTAPTSPAPICGCDFDRRHGRRSKIHQHRSARRDLAAAGARADFTGANLSETDLQGVDFSWATWGPPDYCRRGSNCETQLTNTNFVNSNLAGANFTGAWVNDTNFTGADLHSAIFVGSRLNNVNFVGANPNGVNMGSGGDTWAGLADFSGADLSGADLTGLRSRGRTSPEPTSKARSYRPIETGMAGSPSGQDVNLTDADLVGASGLAILFLPASGRPGFITEAPTVAGANLSGQNLGGLNLAGRDLTGVNLSGADLRKATSPTRTSRARTSPGPTWRALC